jgi:hypothetical protein
MKLTQVLLVDFGCALWALRGTVTSRQADRLIVRDPQQRDDTVRDPRRRA